jgi:hypothetical protein
VQEAATITIATAASLFKVEALATGRRLDGLTLSVQVLALGAVATGTSVAKSTANLNLSHFYYSASCSINKNLYALTN